MDRRIIWSALGLAALLAAVPAHAQTPAAGADLTKTLTQAFDKDPAQGFVEATRLFKERQAAQDLDGMIAVIRVARPAGTRCRYWAPAEDMLDIAIPMAQAAGRWGDLGDLYYERAVLDDIYWDLGATWRCQRVQHYARLGQEAYAKAGRSEPGPADLTRGAAAALAREVAHQRDYFAPQFLGPQWTPAVIDLDTTLGEGRDSEALAKMRSLLTAGLAEPKLEYRWGLAAVLSQALGIRGAEMLLPDLRALQASGGFAGWTLNYTMAGCRMGWSGRPDAFSATFYWCLDHYPAGQRPPGYMLSFAEKMACFRRIGEADDLSAAWVSWVQRTHDGTDWSACSLIRSGMRRDLRQALLGVALSFVLEQKKGMRENANGWWGVLKLAPAGEEQVWAYDIAQQVLDTALKHPDVASRAFGVEDAGRLFLKAGRDGLAAQAKALSVQIAQGDPGALFECALSRAQVSAAAGKWSEVSSALTDVLLGQPASEAVYQGEALLARAEREQGHPDQADRWVGQAADLVKGLKLTSAERADRLLDLVPYTSARGTRVAVLQQAQQYAAEDGLSLLVDRVADQLAQAALDEGDLPAARTKLLEICNRREGQRDRLAFDPSLRQQWFADSLGPYRQLLRVAALQNDPALALSCAERMRSRALADQLAWQKVDLTVGLPAELRARLEHLRTTRTETYALLQRVTASGSGGGGLRGEYLPIRGLVPDDKPVMAGDAPRLKELLGKLATEEAALESVVREAVPAYAAAASTAIPAADDLARSVHEQSGLAVLEYTFSDQGLVVVGIGPATGKVVRIPQTASQMWECIGRLRQAIWEQKPEALTQAAELYNVLVTPVEEVLKDAKSIWVVADGSLQLLPFGTLRDPKGKYLAERLAVASAPSLSLALSSRDARSTPDRVALVVAAPDTGAQECLSDLRGEYLPIRGMYMPVRGEYLPIRGEGGVSDALTAMAKIPLPGAKAEGEVISQWMKGTLLLTGKDAGKERVLKEATDAGILHLATHGYADPDFPDFSGVLLAGADGNPYSVLTAQEVCGMQLRAKLVVLSACQTALGKDVAGEGLLGLTRAFLYAGAQDVMCSLWPVSDESTKVLMEYFYQGLAAGKSPEESLQQAQAALLHNKATAPPFYWAGFVLMHGPR